MRVIAIANTTQPTGKEVVVGAAQSRVDATAAVMTADDDMFDMQLRHRVLQDGENITVGVRNDISNIAMHKQ